MSETPCSTNTPERLRVPASPTSVSASSARPPCRTRQRDSSRAETAFFACINGYMTRNHTVNGHFGASKIVWPSPSSGVGRPNTTTASGHLFRTGYGTSRRRTGKQSPPTGAAPPAPHGTSIPSRNVAGIPASTALIAPAPGQRHIASNCFNRVTVKPSLAHRMSAAETRLSSGS